MSNALSSSDKRALANLEMVVESGLKSFIDVGNALAKIRDDKLYIEKSETFEGYCKARFNIGRAYAYRLIDAAETVDILSPIGDIAAPESESQVRPLLTLETDSQKATAWTKATETAPKKKDGTPNVTAAHVAKVVKEMQADAPPKANGKAHDDKPFKSAEREPGDETETEAAEAARKKAESEHRRNNARQKIDPVHRKAAEKAFGVLMRALDTMDRSKQLTETCRPWMASILEAIRAA